MPNISAIRSSAAALFSALALSACDQNTRTAKTPEVEMVERAVVIEVDVNAANKRIARFVKAGEGYYDPENDRFVQADDPVTALAYMLAIEASAHVDVKLDENGGLKAMKLYMTERIPVSALEPQAAPTPDIR